MVSACDMSNPFVPEYPLCSKKHHCVCTPHVTLLSVLCQFLVIMSSQKQQKTGAPSQHAVEALDALRKSGLLKEVMNLAESEGYPGTTGTMSDASKRRTPSEILDASDFDAESQFNEWGAVSLPPTSQTPMMPSGSTAGVAAQAGLPLGIKSMDEWGSNVCELPKYLSFGYSYIEMWNLAKTDRDMKNYLEWCSNYNGTSVRAKDLGAYVRKMRQSSPVRSYYPGSTDARRFK